MSERLGLDELWEEEEGEFRWEIIDLYSEFDWNNKSMRGAADDARSIELRLREGFGEVIRLDSPLNDNLTVSIGPSAKAVIDNQFDGDQSRWWTAMEEQPVSFNPPGGSYRDCVDGKLVLRISDPDEVKWGEVSITVGIFTLEYLATYFVDWYDRR